MAANHLQKPIHILDEDLLEIVGKSPLTRAQMIKAMREYAKDEDLKNPDNGNEFYPDDLFKACFKEVGIRPKRVMSFISDASKLTGKAAVDAGLIEY